MSDDAHVAATEGACGPMTNEIALRGPMKHGVSTAKRHERTLTAPRHRFDGGLLNNRPQPFASHHRFIVIRVQITESKAGVLHLRQHSSFVGGVNVAVVVVDNSPDACACWTLKIYVA